jgi:hypothetical protein
MSSRSGRGRWQRVLDARSQAREALGGDPKAREAFDGPPVARHGSSEPPPAQRYSDVAAGTGVPVLSLGEAATRLGVSRHELEAMIAAGKFEALPTSFTRLIPTREVERLT